MDPLALTVVFIHLTAAVVWIGGMLFLSAVGPALRRLNVPSSAILFRAMGRRFRDISWAAVVVLVATGVGNLAIEGAFQDLAAFLAANPLLPVKMGLVGAMISVKAAHDFVVGPQASQAMASDLAAAPRLSVWRAAMALGRLNVLLGLVVLFLSVGIANSLGG